jgi:hypothetical protein
MAETLTAPEPVMPKKPAQKPLPEPPSKKRIECFVEPELFDQIEEAAHEFRLPIATYVRTLLIREMRTRQKQNPSE